MKYAETYVAQTEGGNTWQAYTCPKNCEHGKLFPLAGQCPICGAKLYAVRNGKVEHSDHHPKHGGTFFMSADGWHHVEGAWESARELRIYVYDNFTEPVAENTSGTAEVAGQSAKLTLARDRTYLTAMLPEVANDHSVAVRLKFERSSSDELFNFKR